VKTLSLRWRLLLWSSAASIFTLALTVGLVDVSFRGQIRTQLDESLTFALQVARGTWAAQLDDRISETATLALDTRLRAAVSTGDAATARQTLGEVAPPAEGLWSAVLLPDGEVLAATRGAPVQEFREREAFVSEARFFDTGDLWASGDRLTLVGASAVMFGAEALAVLVTGQTVAGAQATGLEMAVGRAAVVVGGGRPTLGEQAGALSGGRADALGSWAATAEDGIEMVELGGERYLAALLPLTATSGERLGSIVLLDSYDDALAPSRRLRTVLLGIVLLGLALSFALSAGFSRGITEPVGRLLDETARLAAGDLDRPIEPMRDDEIGRLAVSFDEMRVSLKTTRAELIRVERLSAIGNAASAVAHDFTQPLSTIAGAIGLLRMDDSDPNSRERCFAAIESELDRLGRMKQEIVEFARGEASLETASIKFDSFLENTVSGVREGLSHKGVLVRVEHGFSDEWSIDSYRLGRVIENLIRNAAGAGAKTIQLDTTSDSGDLVIRVVDDGKGIPVEVIDDIFEPFVTHGKKEGTGLGLAIARNVVGQHGGKIEVESEAGRTTFTLRLPAMESARLEPVSVPT
jgi:signal transduction histidine kinase